VCHGRLNSSAGAVAHRRRPSPVARHRVAREAVADPLLLCALFASSTTGTPRPPGSVAMLPSSSPSPPPVPAAHHLSGLGCFFVAPWPSDKHPGSDLNWAFVSAAGGRLIRSGMAQAGPSQPSARGKVLCSRADESWRGAAMIVRNARFGARPSLDGTGWTAAKREQNMPETASQRQPAPTCTSKASLALTAAGTSNTLHPTRGRRRLGARCLWLVSVQVGRHSSSCNFALLDPSSSPQASSYTVAIIGRRAPPTAVSACPKPAVQPTCDVVDSVSVTAPHRPSRRNLNRPRWGCCISTPFWTLSTLPITSPLHLDHAQEITCGPSATSSFLHWAASCSG
jgi:hypothetical protein